MAERDEQGGRLRLDVFADAQVTSFTPAGSRVMIGRAEGNDLRIDHASVSRRHAVLHIGSPIRIEDLGGANGTSVSDHSVPAVPGETATVRRVSRETVDVAVGDAITLGSVTLSIRRVVPEASGDGAFVIESAAMRKLYDQAALAAASSISVLVLGETGVGKDVLARFIHSRSPRAQKSFLGLHCAALPESLLESELFRHEKGSFTGAVATRPGLFESANGGTVFLDEIGELPMSIQVKLLRLLEAREVLRIGARAPIRVDVRFVSATHRDLDAAVAAGTFREDLYYRLNGLALVIPPLRERKEEILPLADRFVAIACRELDRRNVLTISAEARKLLERHPWPGNVRELKNAIERAIVLCPGNVIEPEHLPPKIVRDTSITTSSQHASGADPERDRILAALEKCGGNQSKAAEVLGMPRRTLVTRLSAYGLTKARKRDGHGGGEADD